MVVGPSLSPVDTALAIAAAVIGLVAIGSTVFILMQFGS